MNHTDNYIDLAKLLFGLGLIFALHKFWMTFCKPVRERFGKFDTLIKEFYPNGGNSMRDVVVRQEKKIDSSLETLGILRKDVTVLKTLKAIDADASPDAKLQFNDSCELIFANRSALKILGLTFEEAKGHGWKTKLNQHYIEALTNEMLNASKDKRRASIDVIVQRSKTDGVNAVVHLVPFVCEKQEFLGFYGHLALMEMPTESA